MQPIETIMGLSLEQIYRLDLKDIKLKRIIDQTNKLLGNILQFTIKHETEIFNDDTLQKQFIELCISIALFGSKGVNKTSKKYPNIIETFTKYDELTVDFTQTTYTKSEKNIHQNNFDYTTLAYIGNIIIWFQLETKRSDFISLDIVKRNYGGLHLWDNLFKEDYINMKRWKHIIKYRELFPFQQNQFIVLMRFMHIAI